MTENILITGARSAAALELAREFNSLGFDTHLADSSAARISRWSNSTTRFHNYPPPRHDQIGFQQRIRQLVDTLKPRLIVPTCEEVFYLASPNLYDDFGSCMFLPNLQTLRILHNKYLFYELCSAENIPVPESQLIQRKSELSSFMPQSSAWVFKPLYSRFGEEVLVGPSTDQLATLTPSPNKPLLAQQRIEGQEASFYAIAVDGKITAFSAYSSNWRLQGGASITFSPLAPNLIKQVNTVANLIAQKLNLTGQFACDLIIDSNGVAHLIECNPRSVSGVHLFDRRGEVARSIVNPSGSLKLGGVKSAYLSAAMFSFGFGSALRHGRCKKWFQDIRNGDDVLSKPDDRLPLIGALLDGIEFVVDGWRKGMSANKASTADIEWNGEEIL